jgi:hypothetical protein
MADVVDQKIVALGPIMSKARAPGIIFGMSEDEYHADPSLGSTSIKNLMSSAADFFWLSGFNALRDDDDDKKDTNLLWGSAFHCLVLEGRREFDRRYASEPDLAGYPVVLDTIKECRDWLESQGVKTTASMTKGLLMTIVRSHWEAVADTEVGLKMLPQMDGVPRPASPLLFDIRAAHASGTKTLLPRAAYDRLILSARMVTANPDLSGWLGRQDQEIETDRPREGYTEVSVFWRVDVALDDGKVVSIPCKCRFDWLGLRAICDIKTIETRGAALGIAVPKQIYTYMYDLQTAHYMEGRERAVGLIKDGKVEVRPGHPAVPEQWLRAFERVRPLTKDDDPATTQFAWSWLWIWVPKKGAPMSEGYRVRRDSDIIQLAEDYRTAMLYRFATHYAAKGESNIWVHYKPTRDLTLDDLPKYPRFDSDSVDYAPTAD